MVESICFVNATDDSLGYSMQANHPSGDNMSDAVNWPSNQIQYAMSSVSHLAGKSVNITKTTVPQSISYAMTSYSAFLTDTPSL